MDEEELVRWLEDQLSRRIPAKVLSLLSDDGFLHVEGEVDRQDLLNRTRKLLQLTPSAPRPARQARKTSTLTRGALRTMAKRDVLRRDALSEYWAKDASTRIEVKRFRAEVLGGRLLTEEEAWRLLESPGASMFGPDELEAEGIDPGRHTSELVNEEGSPSTSYWALVRFGASSTTLEFTGTRDCEEWTLRVDGRRLRSVVWLGSVVHRLRRAAVVLKYPWQPGEAEWFILTGRAPVVAAIEHSFHVHMASHGNRAVVELRVEPWVSAERVTALYRDLQKAILRNRHNRPISERRLNLFRFVTAHTNDEGEAPPWRSLIVEWNRQHKAWKYENVRNFSRDYWAAARLLLFPAYNLAMRED